MLLALCWRRVCAPALPRPVLMSRHCHARSDLCALPALSCQPQKRSNCAVSFDDGATQLDVITGPVDVRCDIFFAASYTSASSDEDDTNPRDTFGEQVRALTSLTQTTHGTCDVAQLSLTCAHPHTRSARSTDY